MDSRAKAIGGNLEVISLVNEGTTVKFVGFIS
jgi:signal transduction histidine kinase